MHSSKSKLMAGAALLAITAAACSSSKSSSSSSAGTTGTTAAAAPASNLPAEIKIGVPLDLTGSAQITGVGTGEQAGVQFALKQINSSGFLGTSKITAVMYDTQADKTQAVARTTQLIGTDKVSAIVGYSLTPSFLAAAPLAQKAGIPVMAVGLSGSGITDVGDFMFRELLDYKNLYKAGDPQFVKATGAKTAAYLYGSDTVTTTGQFNFRKPLIEGLGVKTVATQTITAATTDMRAQLTTIKNAKPDLLVINVDTGQVPTVLVQAQETGLNVQILADTALGSGVVTKNAAAMKAAQCGLFTTPWDAKSQQGGNPQFVSDWKAANNGATPDFFNALGRDAMWAMATAIKSAGSTDPTKIRDALTQLSSFTGALGNYGWDATRNPTYSGTTEQVQNGADVIWSPTTTCTR